MGNVAIHPVAAAGFEAGANAYERGRPSYPRPAVDWLVSRLGIGAGSTVLDLAAGTGKLTRLLVPTGARVVAVEPVAAMRAALGSNLPGIEVLEGAAEDIPLGDSSMNAVTVAQAFHWFRAGEALAEINRVLRPGGHLGLVWNRRDPASPVNAVLESVMGAHRHQIPGHRDRRWKVAFEHSSLFGPPEEAQFAFHQDLDLDGVVDRVTSVSFVAALDEGQRQALVSELRDRLAEREAPIRIDYTTEVHVFRRLQ
jgi:SAM-dependent methyltransferase